MGGFIPTCHTQAFAEMTKVEIIMNLRCKSGDLAIIINETPQSRGNIGRVVEVRGPYEYPDKFGPNGWQIKPIHHTKIWVDIHNCLKAELKFIYWKYPTYILDEWLLPIRPNDNDLDISVVDALIQSSINLFLSQSEDLLKV